MAFLKSTTREKRGTVLLGTTLVLRQPCLGDFKEWVALRKASEKFLRPFEPSWGKDELSRRSFRKRVEFYNCGKREGNAYAFFLKSRANDQLLGGITLSNIRYGVISSGALGYWIGEPFARQGFMSEAVSVLLPFAFNTLNLHRVEAACLTDNLSSVALLQKCGFKQEGLARKYLKINDVWQDHLLFALLEEEF